MGHELQRQQGHELQRQQGHELQRQQGHELQRQQGQERAEAASGDLAGWSTCAISIYECGSVGALNLENR